MPEASVVVIQCDGFGGEKAPAIELAAVCEHRVKFRQRRCAADSAKRNKRQGARLAGEFISLTECKSARRGEYFPDQRSRRGQIAIELRRCSLRRRPWPHRSSPRVRFPRPANRSRYRDGAARRKSCANIRLHSLGQFDESVHRRENQTCAHDNRVRFPGGQSGACFSSARMTAA